MATNQKRKPKKRAPFRPKSSAVKIFFSSFLIFAVLGVIIYGKSETNKMYSEVSRANALLEKLDSENKSMKAELDARTSLKNIEEYAENTLCLKKLDKSQIEYIKVQEKPEVVIAEEDGDVFGNIKKGLNKFRED